ncbi:DUF4132 domain-containing protein [Pigmentiphaga aceris]|uniref:DUF4132 domain-containing protein n=1 Tax=Pigmentiphaga aceris TaxID=1940612 RepID=A0A5C0AVY8_9BURK|nr:DUF4132 domain-containing protein [Pigmentiphaga aceris]QEI05533.1 DUF4132 domain-containing protein [Pigmentiphaga aceris]
MERYELVEGSASKFWEVSVTGDTVTVRFGRIGTNGQTKDKQFADAAAAEKEKLKLVKEKTGKGYALTGSGPSPVPAASAPVVAKPKVEKAATMATPAASESPSTSEKVDAAAASTVAQTNSNSAAAEKSSAPAPTSQKDQSDAATTDASTAFAEECARHGVLFSAEALTTRSRPGPAIDAAAEWKTFCKHIADIEASSSKRPTELQRLKAIDKDSPPTFDLATITALQRDACRVWDDITSRGGMFYTGRFENYLGGLSALVRLGIASVGARAMIDVVQQTRPAKPKQSYQDFAWAQPFTLAMRQAFPATPDEADYDAALRAAQDLAQADPDDGVFYAFIFADDRPGDHLLKPLAQVEAAQAAGADVPAQSPLLPLIIDAPPAAAAQWHQTRPYTLTYRYALTSLESIAATAMAVGRHYNESPLSTLNWLLEYATEAWRTTAARAMLETRDDEAMGLLLPYFHERWIRTAVDAASKAYPVWTFRQLLRLATKHRDEPAIKVRLAELIAKFGEQTVRQWADGLSEKDITTLDERLSAGNAATAPDEAIPALLRKAPWRNPARKGGKLVPVLALKPIATPFVYSEGELSDEMPPRTKPLIDTLDKLGDFIHATEGGKQSNWRPMPPTAAPLPAVDELSGEEWVTWLTQRLSAARAANTYISSTEYAKLYDTLPTHHETLTLALWELSTVALECYVTWEPTVARMFKRFGERAAPGMAALVGSDPLGMLELALPVDSAHIAPHAARALAKLKKAHALAVPWLRRHRHTALMRLIPDAVGKTSQAREAREVAEYTLRWYAFDTEDGRAAIDEAVAAYAAAEPGVVDAVAEILARDAADNVPSKPPKLPNWFQPAVLSRPMLADGSGALTDDAVLGLGEMLMLGAAGEQYVGVARVREELTRDSAAAFAWDVFSTWMSEGAVAKENWALRGVGWLGDDECARRLTKLIRKWPGEAAHARAVTGLDVLADIGTDVALMNLNGIAEKLKFKGLQEKAREKIAVIAEARDLTPEELADRLAPDLNLDERGGMDLDFGERKFRVGFDEFLKPWVKDAEGRRLKDLPKPNKSDDEELSKQASATWSALKKDARAVASLQITRLESMLANSRRVKPSVFDAFFATHPLIRHLTQRLVWGVFADDDARSLPTQVFRVTEDLSAADVNDDPLDVDLSEDASSRIGLVHPLHLDADTRAAWGTVFGDYEIAQPFMQLSRETYALEDQERELHTLTRFAESEVETTRLRGMSTRGWNIGSPQDGGVSVWLERPVTFSDGKPGEVYMHISEGIYAGAAEYEPKTQKMGTLGLGDPWGSGSGNKKVSRTFGELDPISISELLRVPSLVASSAST